MKEGDRKREAEYVCVWKRENGREQRESERERVRERERPN